MKLRDPQLMADYMAVRDFSQSRLARRAGCSRQFVWQLLNDPAKRTCTDEVAERIEEALSVLPGTIFRPSTRVQDGRR
jgi:transcriptional regulator with XRE-family HTH domain